MPRTRSAKSADLVDILIVDDEEAILFTLEDALEGYRLHPFSNPEEALAATASLEQIDIVVTDFRMPVHTGLDILKAVHEKHPSSRAILLTAYSSQELLEEAINHDLIYRIVNKPVGGSELRRIVDEAVADLLRERLEKSEATAHRSLMAGIPCGNAHLVYASPQMQRLVNLSKKFAASSAPVLITGESGVGKELVAALIHQESPRSAQPMINLNCAAIPEHLFESEMFGHVRGAFTGAHTDKQGKFQLAHKGTLFLDEISELPSHQQTKLLRALATGEVVPVGASYSVKVDVRLICATNRDLPALVHLNRFRQDLLFRINILEVQIPPLRERENETIILAEYFLSSIANAEGCATKQLTAEARDHLATLPFSDNNVRELRNLIYRLLISLDHSNITIDDIRAANNGRQLPTTNQSALSLDDTVPFHEFRRNAEKCYLERQLARNNHHLTNTAKSLGLFASNLSRKCKELGISVATGS